MVWPSKISHYKYEALLLLILFAGLYLRIDNLGKESLWMDEAYSLMFARESVIDIIKTNISTIECISNPPLYYIILHFFIQLFGESETALRTASVIFGFLSIIMIYKIGELLFNKDVGLIAALILALSKFHIYFSQEVRSYSLQVLLVLLSFYFFINLFKTKNLKNSIGLVAANILLIYTHHYGMFIILSQNIIFFIIFLFSRPNVNLNLKRWLLLQAAIVILFLPWIGVILNILLSGQSGKVWFTPPVKWLMYTFKEYSGSILLMILFGLLSLYSIVTWIRNKPKEGIAGKDYWKIHFSKNSSIYFLLVWLLVPILVPFIFSRIARPIFLIRYTIAASIPFYLLAATGIKSINRKSVVWASLALVVLFSFINIAEDRAINYKDKWRDVADYVDKNSNSGDLILFNSGDNNLVSFVFNYYSKRTDLNKKPFPANAEWIRMEEVINEIQPVVADYSRVWVVIYRDRDPRETIKKKLCEDYKLVYDRNYTAGTPILYDSGNINLLLFSKEINKNSGKLPYKSIYAAEKNL